MTPEQASDILDTAASFDRRTIGDVDVAAWHEALGALDHNLCVDAVIDYYRTEIRPVMPADVRRRVVAARNEQIARELPDATPNPEAYNHIADRLKPVMLQARQTTAANREAVLAHPDLAKKLTQPPLDYARPEQWNGFIPPKLIATEDGYEVNNSPRRHALNRLLEEALARKATP